MINYLLFGNSDYPFAEKYFSWFWGNMWKAAGDKAKKVTAALVTTEAKRQHENQQRNDYADKHTSGVKIFFLAHHNQTT